MTTLKRSILLLAGVAAVAALGPELAFGATSSVRGVVVANQHGAALVAGPRGAVRALRGSARPGSRVVVTGTRLRVVGRAHSTRLRGIVVRRAGGLTFLSVAHRIVVLRHAARALAASGAGGPVAGDVVTSTVSIDDHGDLAEHGLVAVGHDDTIEIEGTVVAVGNGTVTLSVGGQQVTIPLPAGVTIPASAVGTQTNVEIEFGDDNGNGQGEDQGQNTGTGPGATAGDDGGNNDAGDDNGGDGSGGGSGSSGGSNDGSGGDHGGSGHGGDDG